MRLRALSSLFLTACLLPGVAAAQTPAEWQDVIRNLRHPNPQTRLSAVEKLDAAGYVPAVEPVAALIADPDDRVQLAAIEAELSFFLADRVGGGGWALGGGGGKSHAQQAFEAGPTFRTAGVAPAVLIDRLIAALRDETPRVQFDAIHALGFIAEAPLTPAQLKSLAAELDHYDPIIRAATARVLGRLRAREAADQLAVAMVDSNALVRLYATEAIGRVRDAKSAVPLRDQLSRSRGGMLTVTLAALAQIGAHEDVGLFRQRLADKSAVLRRAAAEGLGRVGEPESLSALDALLKTEKSDTVRLALQFALQKLGQTHTHEIASALVVDDLTAQARDYLFELGAIAVPGIQAALKVATAPRHRADLVQLTGYLGKSDDVPTLEPFLKDKDERVRRAATEAITRLRR